MTIVEFLLARIAEDEAVAREVNPDAWDYDVTANREAWADEDRVSVGVGRVLADCEAKRRIVETHDGTVAGQPNTHPCDGTSGVYECDTLRALASVYADHPDYDEAWRP